jgi:hypothetical protein
VVPEGTSGGKLHTIRGSRKQEFENGKELKISRFQRQGGGVLPVPVPVREGRSIEVMKTPRLGTTH